MIRRSCRRLATVLLALAAGVGAAVALPALAPGDAPPSSASFIARDFSWEVDGGSATSVTIAVGGTVAFAYPSGAYRHNADFSNTPPSSCTQTAGVDSGPVPPLPAHPTTHGWSGTCSFDAPGTYSFHCDEHPSMHGTIEVVDPNAPPPTTPPTGTTQAPPPGQTTPPPGDGTVGHPGDGTVPLHATVARSQAGATVRGTVRLPSSGWRLVVRAFASGRALAAHPPAHARKVRVGTALIHRTRAEATSFAIALGRRARAALRRHHRLVVSLEIVATLTTADDERAAATTLRVVVRERRPLPA
jgi:plastocyanin